MKTLSALAILAVLIPGAASAANIGGTQLSDADHAQIQGDLKLIAKAGKLVRDEDPDAKAERLHSCVTYWDEHLHRNRSPEARRLVLAARVARCMHVTHYTMHGSVCKWRFGGEPVERQIAGFLMQARCYSKFA
jgi:hypothetical protein